MPFYELQLDQKSAKTHWRLSKRRRNCLHFYRNIPEKNLLQFDFLGAWSEQRFTLNVVERVIPVNESPVIRSVPIEQIRLENIYRYKINAFDPNNNYLTYTISRGDDGDQSFAVDVDFKLTGTAFYSEQWTDFRLYDEDDNEITLTYDETEEAHFGTVSIAAGESETTIKLKPRNNIFYEPDETVILDIVGVDYSTKVVEVHP